MISRKSGILVGRRVVVAFPSSFSHAGQKQFWIFDTSAGDGFGNSGADVGIISWVP